MTRRAIQDILIEHGVGVESIEIAKPAYAPLTQQWLLDVFMPAFKDFHKRLNIQEDLEEQADIYASTLYAQTVGTREFPAFGCVWQHGRERLNAIITPAREIVLLNPYREQIVKSDISGCHLFLL